MLKYFPKRIEFNNNFKYCIIDLFDTNFKEGLKNQI